MHDISKTRDEVRLLIRQRDRLEGHNLAIGPMRMGTLIEHYKKCGKPRCACTQGKLHGPYWYMVSRQQGKSVLAYVSKEQLSRVRHLAGNYKRFQDNMANIRKLNARILHLLGQLRADRLGEQK